MRSRNSGLESVAQSLSNHRLCLDLNFKFTQIWPRCKSIYEIFPIFWLGEDSGTFLKNLRFCIKFDSGEGRS
jgi:hypothetical protein